MQLTDFALDPAVKQSATVHGTDSSDYYQLIDAVQDDEGTFTVRYRKHVCFIGWIECTVEKVKREGDTYLIPLGFIRLTETVT